MGQQLLEEQKENLHYRVQHSPIQEFLPASAADKLTHVYRLYNKKKKFFLPAELYTIILYRKVYRIWYTIYYDKIQNEIT